MNVLHLERTAEDQLPNAAWPGGYPIVYYTPTGDMLCPPCATEELDTACSGDDRVEPYDGPQWSDILYEGIEFCTQCETGVRGAYEEED